MRVFVAAGLLLASMAAHADEVHKDQVCMSWARNASIGSGHAVMGHARRLIPMSAEAIQELIEHNQFFSIDGIPVLNDDNDTPEGRAFLEDSIFFGYDYVQQLSADARPASQQQMVALFLNICRSEDQTAMR